MTSLSFLGDVDLLRSSPLNHQVCTVELVYRDEIGCKTECCVAHRLVVLLLLLLLLFFPESTHTFLILSSPSSTTSIIPPIVSLSSVYFFATVALAIQENKLFIGMLSRKAGEDEVRELFTPFGEIREIYMIRNADGTSKCAAFLRYVTREAALQAIENLNLSVVMEGATRPLIVKFADTKAQRQARQLRNSRKEQMMAAMRASPAFPGYQVSKKGPGIDSKPQRGPRRFLVHVLTNVTFLFWLVFFVILSVSEFRCLRFLARWEFLRSTRSPRTTTRTLLGNHRTVLHTHHRTPSFILLT